MSDRGEKAQRQRGKRFNLKFAAEHKARFKEPYNEFIISLLARLPSPTAPNPLSPEMNTLLLTSLHNAPKGTGWTVWISQELRDRFLATKNSYSPSSTHSGFVEFLLGLGDNNSSLGPSVGADSANGWEPKVNVNGAITLPPINLPPINIPSIILPPINLQHGGPSMSAQANNQYSVPQTLHPIQSYASPITQDLTEAATSMTMLSNVVRPPEDISYQQRGSPHSAYGQPVEGTPYQQRVSPHSAYGQPPSFHYSGPPINNAVWQSPVNVVQSHQQQQLGNPQPHQNYYHQQYQQQSDYATPTAPDSFVSMMRRKSDVPPRHEIQEARTADNTRAHHEGYDAGAGTVSQSTRYNPYGRPETTKAKATTSTEPREPPYCYLHGVHHDH